VEKYRPSKLDEILGNKKVVAILKGFVESGEMPNLAFVGKSGTGKTAAAWALATELGCAPGGPGFLELNASDERGIDVVREKVKNFAQTLAVTPCGFKICLLDESDELTKNAQQALRRVMERYYKTVRFIITANNKGKLSEAIKSRSPPLQFRGLHPSHMGALLVKVERAEGKLMPSTVNNAIIKAVHGDARKGLNILETLMQLENPQHEDVNELFGLVDEETVWGIMFGALKGQMSAIDKANALVNDGTNPSEILNTMYFSALKGSIRGMTERNRLIILQAMGALPPASDQMHLTAILAKIIMESRPKESF